jgi:hypothetical protein
MTKLLVTLYLQLEKLWRNPAAWFAESPWLVRVLVVLLIFPAISLSSIAWYATTYGPQGRTQELLNQNYSELQNLRVQLEANDQRYQADMEMVKNTLTQLKRNQGQNVLGEDDDTSAVLGDGAEAGVASGSSHIVHVVIEAGDAPVPVYAEPSTTAKIVTRLDLDALYFVLDKKTGWYELDLNQGKKGWVQADSVLELP